MKRMLRIIGVGLAAIALTALTNGCRLHSKLDETWGESYTAQMAWQRANPDDPTTTEPLENLDPETGMRVADRYYEGQEQQRQREAPTINIGEM